MEKSLQSDLDRCQLADQYRFRRKIRQLEKTGISAQKKSQELAKLATAMERSIAACEARATAIPSQISFPSLLPITEKVKEITALLETHQVIVVAGDTGSGKTTQLPKICLQAGLGCRGLIGHTQPRRLAAVSVANRIAEELATQPGEGVGFQVRFNEKQSASSFLKLMTDGILLAEIQNDRFLNRYEAIIIDEAHERSLNIDFLLGFLKQLTGKRSDLKLVITSATIDVDKFSSHFHNAPIVSVSGRTYPVDTRYMPLVSPNNEEKNDDLQIDGIVTALRDIAASETAARLGPGDVLVFLSSEREIRDMAAELRKQRFNNTEVLPLYARLRHSEQLKIFKPHPGRRVVLATNVAETSLTVPGIRYVVDTGFARISRYSLQSKVQRLPIEAVSRASANQRKGRCGRLEDGICIRLYSETDFDSRPLYTDPEIKRTNLASVILRMLYLKLGDVEDFPFIETPEPSAIREGFKLLVELNALTHNRQLTDIGRRMAMLPVDPRYARMLVTANSELCLREVLIIVSVLSIQDPREISSEDRQSALQKLAQFNHPESDFLGFVNLWNHYETQRQDLSQNQLRKYCKTHFLSFMRMREWREVHRQLLFSCQQMGFKLNKEPVNYESIHRSIISGSLNQIARQLEGKMYLGNRNRKFSLFSSSVMSSAAAKWIVSGDLIETSQTFATMAARIQPQWVEQMALHLVKREYFEPHWSKKRQEVMAYEKVHLYGLVIIEKAPIRYSAIDPDVCREIFIREGLGENQVSPALSFLTKNQQFLEELSLQEEKIRRPDVLVSDREIARFYEERIPPEVISTQSLEQWLTGQGDESLTMDLDSFSDSQAVIAEVNAYPDQASLKHNSLEIDYVFDPGSPQDGATVAVPLGVLHQLNQTDIDWAVPGIIREKCLALIKGLPKSLRKQFIPIGEFIDAALPQMSPSDGELIDSLLAQIHLHKKLDLSREDFQCIEIPAHLRIKLRLLGADGQELGFSDQVRELQTRHAASLGGSKTHNHSSHYGHDIEQQGLTDWTIDTLPEQLKIGKELALIRYPALVDKTDSVSIELLADEAESQLKMRPGLVRLYMLRSVQQRNMLRKNFSRLVKELALMIPANLAGLAEDALFASYAAAFEVDQQAPRSKQEFESSLQAGKQKLHQLSEQITKIVRFVLPSRLQILRQLDSLDGSDLNYLATDVRQQIEHLLPEHFLINTLFIWLQEMPRYFKAIQSRLEKLPHVGARDRSNSRELGEYWNRYQAIGSDLKLGKRAELQTLRWMIEEYRVSLFAQALGTRLPVSAKRLDKLIEQLMH
ncbi:MAG: ATP-dependent RNA helicase HrpA [Gammaproteobacteria bacterium]|nr:ATP-dependent RNA helicase HrpA [Gammaproteobacteria bacterium]